MNRLLQTLNFLLLLTNAALAQQFALQPVRTFQGSEHGFRKAVFAPDGKSFATGGTRGEVLVWDIATGQVRTRMEGHYSSVNDLRYSKDGSLIVTAASDGHVKVWNASSGRLMIRFNSGDAAGGRSLVHFALLSSDNRTVYFGGDDRKVRSCAVDGSTPCQTLYTDPKESIRCAALSPDGTELVFAGGRYLMVLNVASGSVAREYNTGTCEITALQYSADGKQMLSWCANARVDIRDAKTFALQTSFRNSTGGRRFSNLAFTDDQRYIVTGDHASRFQMWDLQEKRLVMDQGAEQGTILDFDVHSSPVLLLSASLDRTVKLWQIGTKTEEEAPKKNKKQEVEPEPVPEVVILTQDDLVAEEDDLVQEMVAVETREVAPPKIVAMPVVSETEQRPEVLKEPEIELQEGDSLSPLPETLNGRRIKPIRSDHRLNLLGRNLVIEVWDAQVIDGDIISLFMGDECILKEFSIVSDRQRVEFDASAFKRVYLYLHAHNVGTIPPNTATLMVSDGIQQIQVEMRSDLTGTSAMELNFVDP